MQTLNNISTADNYDQGAFPCTIQDVWRSSGGYAIVTGNDAFMQLQYGPQGQGQWTREVHIPANTPIEIDPNTAGVRFRSYLPGQPALVSGALSERAEPRVTIASAGTANVISSVLQAPVTLLNGFAPKTGLGPAVSFDLEGSGTGPGDGVGAVFFKLMITSDDIDQGNPPGTGTKVDGLKVEHHYGGVAMEGGRNTLEANSFFDGGASSASNPDRNYVALQGQFIAFNSDGGGLGTEKGAGFGLGSWAQLKAAATHFLNITGGEFDILTDAGTQPNYLSGIQICGAVQSNGVSYDTGIALSGLANAGGHVGFKNGFLIGNMNGLPALASTSTLLAVQNHATLSKGFDLSTTAFTTFALNANGFTIGAPNGNHSIEIGRIDGSASTPFMDWHSGAAAVDYDSRLIASGGDGTTGHGVLSAVLGQFAIQGQQTGVEPMIVNGAAGITHDLQQWQVNNARVFSVNAQGAPFYSSGNESTGAGSAALGANCPAGTLTAPYKWLLMFTSDGSGVWVPAWK